MKAENRQVVERVESHLRIVERDAGTHWAELAEKYVRREVDEIVRPLAAAIGELAVTQRELAAAVRGLGADDLITVEQTATMLNVTNKCVYRWIQIGQLKAYRLGKRLLRINKAEALKIAEAK